MMLMIHGGVFYLLKLLRVFSSLVKCSRISQSYASSQFAFLLCLLCKQSFFSATAPLPKKISAHPYFLGALNCHWHLFYAPVPGKVRRCRNLQKDIQMGILFYVYFGHPPSIEEPLSGFFVFYNTWCPTLKTVHRTVFLTLW